VTATAATLAGAYDLVIFDLDGVVYLGSQPIPGAAEAIATTVEGGTPVAYVTNNASRRAPEVAELLRSMGVPARDDEVLTSARAAAEMLAEDLPAGAPVFVVGAPALREEVAAVGLRVAEAKERPAAVVQGYGPDVSWRDLAEACVAIRAGARWVVTNLDATLPSPRGPLPGNGSLVAALRTALGGRGPDLVVGKPEPALFHIATTHIAAKRVLVVGDRLDTDIEGAVRAGMDSLLVLTGVSTAADVLRAAAHERPTHLAADCSALSTPEDQAAIPPWQDGRARADGWQVTYADRRLVLSRDGAGRAGGAMPDRHEAASAVRALAAASWAQPDWIAIEPVGPAAEAALAVVGLDRYEGWEVTAAYGA